MRHINGLAWGNLCQVFLNNSTSIDKFGPQGYQVKSFHHFVTFQKTQKTFSENLDSYKSMTDKSMSQITPQGIKRTALFEYTKECLMLCAIQTFW